MKVHLIRHGDARDGQLTKLGHLQANNTGIYLAKLESAGIAGLFSSDKPRSEGTALDISMHLGGMPVITDSRLREKLSFEDYPKRVPLQQKRADWERTLTDPEWTPEYGMSTATVVRNLDAFLQELSDRGQTENPYVVVAHGGILESWLRTHFSPEELNRLMPEFSEIGKSRMKGLDNCSITTFAMDGSQYTIEAVNFTGHLANGSWETHPRESTRRRDSFR